MILFFAVLSLAAWLYLLLFRGGYWRCAERLETRRDDAASPRPAPPRVVAVIPARNEADSIARVVAAHLKSDLPGGYPIMLVDDGSTDGTADLARATAANAPGRLTVIDGAPLRQGWTGKLWAMRQGIEAARTHDPDYLLFCDADIEFAPETVSRLTLKAASDGLDLVSLMALLDARGAWGGLLAPAFVYFFQKLYPFAFANDPFNNVAAAAGGCMLARADAVDAIGGVDAFKDALIDDCALARAIKDRDADARIWIGLADDEAVSLRDNRSLSSIWNMVARTAFAQLNFSPMLLVGALLGMALLYIAPPLIALGLFAHGDVAASLIALGAWGVMAATFWPMLKLYRQQPWQSTLLPIAGALYTAMTFASALRHWRGAGGQWKGRTYDPANTL
ncbi:MAG: glycosyltransferase [Pseudomonadota bacterium]